MENKKIIIGGILGIGLLIALIWFLFFRKGKSGQSVVAGILPNNNNPNRQQNTNQQPQKQQVVYVNSGSTSTFPLRQGSRGQEVRVLQEALNKAGYNVGTADGVWGARTQAEFAKAFPNKLGVNDLKDLEEILAKLSGKSPQTQTQTQTSQQKPKMYEIGFDSNLANKRATVVSPRVFVKRNPVTEPKTYIGGVYYESGERITLTGRLVVTPKDDGTGQVTWVEFERHNNNGLAWINREMISY